MGGGPQSSAQARQRNLERAQVSHRSAHICLSIYLYTHTHISTLSACPSTHPPIHPPPTHPPIHPSACVLVDCWTFSMSSSVVLPDWRLKLVLGPPPVSSSSSCVCSHQLVVPGLGWTPEAGLLSISVHLRSRSVLLSCVWLEACVGAKATSSSSSRPAPGPAEPSAVGRKLQVLSCCFWSPLGLSRPRFSAGTSDQQR